MNAHVAIFSRVLLIKEHNCHLFALEPPRTPGLPLNTLLKGNAVCSIDEMGSSPYLF